MPLISIILCDPIIFNSVPIVTVSATISSAPPAKADIVMLPSVSLALTCPIKLLLPAVFTLKPSNLVPTAIPLVPTTGIVTSEFDAGKVVLVLTVVVTGLPFAIKFLNSDIR